MERVRIIFLVLAVLFVPTTILYSKHGVPQPVSPATEFSVFEENGKVGLKDKAGQVLIPATYESIGWSNGTLSIVDKVVGYQSGGHWGLIHTSNKLVTAPEFLDVKPGEGSYIVAQKRSSLSQRATFGIINTSGKTIIPFLYDGLQLANMRAVVMSRSGATYKFGLIDLSHKIIVPVQYRSVYSLGSLRYAVENDERKTAIFSDEGQQITEFVIDSISSFWKDHAVVYQNQKQGLIDRSGQMIVRPQYREVRFKDDGVIEVRATDEWLLLSGDNKVLGQCEGDMILPRSAERYAVVTAGKYQLTDNEFKPLHKDRFSSLGDFKNGIAVFSTPSGAGVINDQGKEIIPPQYRELVIDRHALRARTDIGYKDRWILLDANGRRITEKHYEYIAPFNGKYYPAKNRGYWGALDANGEEIITCVHDSLLQNAGKNIVVKFKGEYGVMDLNENWIATPRVNRIEILNDENYLEFSGSTTFLKSYPNNIIYFSGNALSFTGSNIREELPTGAYWTIDMNGIIVDRSNEPVKTEVVFFETEGLRAILKDGKYGFIDEAGRLRIANRYEEVKPFSNGLAAIRIMGKWGFIDHSEKLVVQPVYDDVGAFSNGQAIVKKDGLAGLIDVSGKVILPVRYDEIIPNPNKRYILRQGDVYGLADTSGALIIQPRYDTIVDAGNGYVIAERAGKFGVLTLKGVSTIPMVYDELSFDPHHDHFIAVKRSAWQQLAKTN